MCSSVPDGVRQFGERKRPKNTKFIEKIVGTGARVPQSNREKFLIEKNSANRKKIVINTRRSNLNINSNTQANARKDRKRFRGEGKVVKIEI